MNDTPNFQNPTNPDPTRRLKKVKRPIKRIPPQGGNMPASPMPQNNFAAGNPQRPVDDDFNLNSYPEEGNLPALADAPARNNPQNNIPHFINDEEMMYEQNPAAFSANAPVVPKKIAIAIGVAAFLVGALFAKILFGEQKVVRDGLQGVVVNSEVPRGRARCGVAEKTQGCVLYIMNPQRQELSASDFYDLASQLTGRQRFIIETGNMRYSNRKIKPGEIAQFNIPPLQ